MQTQPVEIYATFCGPIDQHAVQRIMNGAATAAQNGVKHVHLLFQSTGGAVGDGVCLYNFFKSLPVQLTLYNVGSVQSAAVIAYLGAGKRKTSARATFMIHRTTISPQFANSGALKSFAQQISLDDGRTEAILREHVDIPNERWSDLDKQDLWFSGEEAVKVRLAQELGEFSPPQGSVLYSL